jgi:hypothetical protein
MWTLPQPGSMISSLSLKHDDAVAEEVVQFRMAGVTEHCKWWVETNGRILHTHVHLEGQSRTKTLWIRGKRSCPNRLLFFFTCGEVRQSPVSTSAITGPTYYISPGLMMMIMLIVERLVEWELARETEVLGQNLSQCPFVHHISHMT